MSCLVTGSLLLGVPAARALAGGAAGSPLVALLAVGALAVLAVGARPRAGSAGALAGLAVLCAALALLTEPAAPLADGTAGLAALAFLLTLQWHRRARGVAGDLGSWLAARRSGLAGAVITTSAAIVAATVPLGWALPAAVLVGLVLGRVCVPLCRDGVPKPPDSVC